ncbi:MAG: glycosyltransferase [Clostridia bacterium]|nr:glycosyltransferase [Clostridia bacterium]
MDNNLISIIIPVYNVEKYLRECLDSVLNQTYKNYEVILVDDGSVDNSPIICDEYAKKFNFKVFHNENHGVSFSRNYGIEKSNGNYITFIDSDDVIDKDYLRLLTEKANQTNCDICFCGFKRFTKTETTAISETLDKLDGVEPKIVAKVILGFNNDYKLLSSSCRALYKKECISRFNVNVKHGEDLLFVVNSLFASKKIATINEYLYYYRVNENSCTNRYIKNFLDSNLAYYEEISKLFVNDKTKLDIIKFRGARICFWNEISNRKTNKGFKKNIKEIKRSIFYKEYKLKYIKLYKGLKNKVLFIIDFFTIKLGLYNFLK